MLLSRLERWPNGLAQRSPPSPVTWMTMLIHSLHSSRAGSVVSDTPMLPDQMLPQLRIAILCLACMINSTTCLVHSVSFASMQYLGCTSVILFACRVYASIKSCSNPLRLFGLRLSLLIWVVSMAEMSLSLTLKRCSLWSAGLIPLACVRSCTFSHLLNQAYRRLCYIAYILTKSLTDLSKNRVPSDWTSSCDYTVKALKHCFKPAYVLAFPDLIKPFELVCDASGYEVGAVLLQEGRPLGYSSRKVTAAECNYVFTEEDLLATIEALHGFRCYLLSGGQLVTRNRPTRFCRFSQSSLGVKAHRSEYLRRFTPHLGAQIWKAQCLPLRRSSNLKHLERFACCHN